MTGSSEQEVRDELTALGAVTAGRCGARAGERTVERVLGGVAERIVAGLAAGETAVFPDDVSAGMSSVYLSDPLKLEQMLTG